MSSTRDALALHAVGRTTEALSLLFDALGAPNRSLPVAEEKQLLAQLLEGVALTSGNDVIHRVLLELLHDTAIDTQQVARATLGLIEASAEFAVLEQWSTRPDAEIDEQQLAPAVQAFCALPLVRTLLPRVVVSTERTESLCTFVRRVLLATLTGDTPGEPWHWDAVVMMGQAAFNGEYAWRERDDERQFVDAAQTHLAEWLSSDTAPSTWTDAPAPLLLLYALYRRLTQLPHWPRLAECPATAWQPFDPWVKPTLVTHVLERLEEHRLAAAMPMLSHPSHRAADDTSERVRAMYETHPYPRWTTMGMPRVTSVATVVRELTGQSAPPDALRLLIAGCGTGRQAAHTARSFPEARLLALDLSRASLGYAARRTQSLGIETVEFRQGDILALETLQEDFAMIFCSGVLHHMANPRLGWAQLVQRLHPRGVMKIALYSEIARQSVTAARTLVEAERRQGTDDAVRRARETLLALPSDHPARAVTDSTDFYSLSGCRDLVMHVQERTYTIPALAAELDALQLRFLGFQLSVSVQHAFSREYPATGAARDLNAWAQFEQRYPNTFWGMYQFFVGRR